MLRTLTKSKERLKQQIGRGIANVEISHHIIIINIYIFINHIHVIHVSDLCERDELSIKRN